MVPVGLQDDIVALVVDAHDIVDVDVPGHLKAHALALKARFQSIRDVRVSAAKDDGVLEGLRAGDVEGVLPAGPADVNATESVCKMPNLAITELVAARAAADANALSTRRRL